MNEKIELLTLVAWYGALQWSVKFKMATVARLELAIEEINQSLAARDAFATWRI